MPTVDAVPTDEEEARRALEARNAKTAFNTRHLLKTGTVADVLAFFPPVPQGQAPANHANVFSAIPTDLTNLEEVARRYYARIDDKDVLAARRFLKEAHIVEFLDQLITEQKASPGPTVRVTTEALLVAMLLAALLQRPMLLTEFSDILFHCISPAMRRMLNVSDGRTKRSPIPRKFRRWNKSAAKAVGQTFARMTSVIDPCDEITTRKQRYWIDMEFRGLTDDQMAHYQALLDWVCGQLLLVSYNTMPESMRAQDRGDRCADGTGVEMFTRTRGVNNPQAMSAPHAAMWGRDGNHGDPDDNQPSGPAAPADAAPGSRRNQRRRARDKFFPGLELHLLTTSDTTPGDNQYLPAGFVTSMTMDRPGRDIAGNARRLIASELHRGFNTGFMTGDGLYAKANADTFQIPARAAGYKIILPILDEHVGIQASHPSGAFVENGTWRCPAMPQHLIDALADYRSSRIDQTTYLSRIQAAKKFELVTKQKPDLNGIGERIGCRAANHSLTAKCPLKPASMEPRPTIDRNGDLADHRPQIFPPEDLFTNGRPPSICNKQAITLNPEDAAKFRQDLPIGDEHTDIFNGLRQPTEGMNGTIKDPAKEALGVPGRRRVRTKVAQQLFAAFLITAANLRMIRSFIERASIDSRGRFFVKRVERKGEHARTGLPPGTARPPSTGDPPEVPAA